MRMLNIATCQQNMGDSEAAKKSLEELVAKYPLERCRGESQEAPRCP